MDVAGCEVEGGHLPLTFNGRGAVLADFRFKATPVCHMQEIVSLPMDLLALVQ